MIEVRHTTSATPQAVFDVLTDGWLYASWVVGASRVRAVDDTWPAQGARLHHSFGLWPALINDSTHVLSSVPGQRLVLQARGWPAGEATVDIRLLPLDAAGGEGIGEGTNGAGGCVIVLGEDATKGPGRLVPPPLRKAALVVRNRETLRRLAMLAEGGAARPHTHLSTEAPS
ncbi:MAG: SRPBCC family protein [Kineosporiaceae bacterium]